jgi:hypothetical protein
MIREFFNPRIALVFVVLWCLSAFAMYLWLHMSPAKHRRFLRRSRVPALAAGFSSITCIVVVVLLTLLP